jgi:hypothetical protein
MAEDVGKKVPMSLPRRLICDLLYFARQNPSIPVQRWMSLAPLVQARREARVRISWCTLFLKAFSLVARQIPELRRTYIPFPFPHFYEHPISIASVALERDYRGEKAVLFGHLRGPDNQALGELERYLRRYKEEPVEQFGLFRRALFVSRFPWPLRWFAWWLSLNWSGQKRASRMGTFGVSVYSGLGAESLHPLSPLPTLLNYGVIQEDGRVPVRITYDHRVMDGSTVARVLVLLEQTLNTEILAELGAAQPAQAA